MALLQIHSAILKKFSIFLVALRLKHYEEFKFHEKPFHTRVYRVHRP